MTKIHLESQKLQNDQNNVETSKMIKIISKPKNDKNTRKHQNDQNIPKTQKLPK